MPAIRSLHSRTFEQLLAKQRMQLLEALAGGLDHETYLKLCGQIQGLDMAARISEETDFTLSGEEPDAGA